MSFLLQDLEAALPAGILQKGLDYYAAGYVTALDRRGSGWNAMVKGTKDYTVVIEGKDQQITGWTCKCPYDHGPVCKHVAAVLFAIRSQQQEAELQKMPYFRKGKP
jgi:uncharacterized Zn finger protein